jgi:hypothetical protein
MRYKKTDVDGKSRAGLAARMNVTTTTGDGQMEKSSFSFRMGKIRAALAGVAGLPTAINNIKKSGKGYGKKKWIEIVERKRERMREMKKKWEAKKKVMKEGIKRKLAGF